MSKKKYDLSVQNANLAFSRWCNEVNIPLHRIDHVITWEDWDDGIGVYLFLGKTSDVESLRPEQQDQMKRAYLGFLKDAGYPFEKFPNVVFEIDSDENVRNNYQGNYFYRVWRS